MLGHAEAGVAVQVETRGSIASHDGGTTDARTHARGATRIQRRMLLLVLGGGWKGKEGERPASRDGKNDVAQRGRSGWMDGRTDTCLDALRSAFPWAVREAVSRKLSLLSPVLGVFLRIGGLDPEVLYCVFYPE